MEKNFKEREKDKKDFLLLRIFLRSRINKSLFKAFMDGLKSNGKFLSKKELELLPLSAVLMPFIHGLRALTDYLNGNVYYKVSYPKQNLIRCKNLFSFSRI